MAKSSVHQRIDDHEKLCRIMQQETNRKMISLTRAIHRLEKFVVGMIGMVMIGMGTIIIELFNKI